jgi:diaminopropionate ammonia-lyase
MPCYQPTPLVELPELAVELGVAAVLVKDESHRLSLPAFKILGASWAVNYALSQRSGFDAPATCLTELRERSGPVTLVTATDGNHGRAVARMAALLGLAARIYIPAGTAAKYAFLRSSPHLQPTADRGLPRTSDLAGQVDRQPSIARATRRACT